MTPPVQRLVSQEIEDGIHDLRERWKVPGLVWWTTYIPSGVSTSRGDRVTEHTFWAGASNTKVLLATSIGMLIEEGITLPSGSKLGWDSKVYEVLDWELGDAYKEEERSLTLRDLLSMQSGLPAHNWAAVQDGTAEEELAQVKHFRFSSRRGEAWQYNNYAYQVLALAFPKYANTEWIDFVQRRIFNPLSMRATFDYARAIGLGMSHSFLRRHGDLKACEDFKESTGPNRERVFQEALGDIASGGHWSEGHPNPGMAGAGGMLLNGEDMAKLMRGLLDPEHNVISKTILDAVTAIQAPCEEKPKFPEFGIEHYGMGQELVTYRGNHVIKHNGMLPGQYSYSMRIPQAGVGVMVAANDDLAGSAISNAICYTVLDHLLGLEPIDWAERYSQMAVDFAQAKLTSESVPNNPRPPTDIQGTFRDEGYGSLIIRRQSSGRYVSSVDKRFVSHIEFIPNDGPIWEWRVTKKFPEHLRDGSTKAQLSWGHFHGKCVVKKDGIGMYGDFSGRGPLLPKREVDEENTEETAEVWFERCA